MTTAVRGRAGSRPESSVDDVGRDFLKGLIRLLVDDSPAARKWHRQVAEDALAPGADRELFRAIGRAIELRQQPNLLEVKFIIEHDDTIVCDPADAVTLLSDLYHESLISPFHLWIETAARKLEERRRLNQAADLGRSLMAVASAGKLPNEAEIDDVIRQARQIQLASRSGTQDARDLLSIADSWKRNKTEKVLLTGFSFLDRAFGGGLSVGAHGIAAKPKAGKSAIAAQIALGVMQRNPEARVLWFRGEMTDDLVFSKMLACWSKMRCDVLRPITLRDALHRSPESQPAFRDLVTTIGDRFITVDPPLTVAAIEHHIEERQPALAIVDYLQKCESPTFKDRREGLDHVVSRLSMAATRYEIPIVVVSAVAKGTDKDSEIGSITKESNRLDYDCHTLISLWNDGPVEDNPRRILMRVNASRTGQQLDDTLWFHGRHQFFQAAATHSDFDEFSQPLGAL